MAPLPPVTHPYDLSSDIQDIAFEDLQKILPKTATKILDIGCGTGKNTATLKSIYPDATIVGIDPKATMITHAKATYTDIQFINTDIATFHEEHALFDLIISNATLHWCKNWQVVSEKLSKLCADDGQVVFSYFGPNTFQELNDSLKAISEGGWATSADAFLPYNEILPELKKQFSTINAYTLQITEQHETLLDLLKKIKATEVNIPQKNKPFILSKKNLTALNNMYIQKYGQIISTYDITIVNLKK